MIYNNILFQESCSTNMYWLSSFHDFSLAIIFAILTFVAMITYSVMTNIYLSSTLISEVLEIVWTVIPMIILVTLALPSLSCLYMMEEMHTEINFKAIGHQWYWSYETPDKEFNSYMKSGAFRLLDVDARMVIPFNKIVKTLITSADVLHCWTVPALGVKADAVPGRINQVNFMSLRPSVLYGQCSEICGANHSFMPIVLESIPFKLFWQWN